MPYCHIAIISPYASLKLCVAKRRVRQISTSFTPHSQCADHAPQPGPPNTISGSGFKPLVPPWLLGGRLLTLARGR